MRRQSIISFDTGMNIFAVLLVTTIVGGVVVLIWWFASYIENEEINQDQYKHLQEWLDSPLKDEIEEAYADGKITCGEYEAIRASRRAYLRECEKNKLKEAFEAKPKKEAHTQFE
jgi:hypothetical protein